MLARKLLNSPDFEMDNEYRTLELLTRRFGESSLHACEVMLKDIKTSMRTTANIATKLESYRNRAANDGMDDDDEKVPDYGDTSCPTVNVSPMIVSQVSSGHVCSLWFPKHTLRYVSCRRGLLSAWP